MMSFWKEAVKYTGPVAVVGFLIWLVTNTIFSKEIFGAFGTEQRFVITLLVISGLLVALLASISAYKKSKQSGSGDVKIKYKNSTHKGNNIFK